MAYAGIRCQAQIVLLSETNRGKTSTNLLNILNPLTSHKNRPELPGSYAAFVFVDPSYKNQEKDIDIRTRHWHWHWLCFSAFFLPWGVTPPKRGKNEKNKANANANAWFLYQCLFPGSYVR